MYLVRVSLIFVKLVHILWQNYFLFSALMSCGGSASARCDLQSFLKATCNCCVLKSDCCLLNLREVLLFTPLLQQLLTAGRKRFSGAGPEWAPELTGAERVGSIARLNSLYSHHEENERRDHRDDDGGS